MDVWMASGDIKLAGNGDLKVSDWENEVSQGIWFRLQTVAGDYLLAPDCGASLETFIGEPNTRETGEAIQAAVFQALTQDGFLESDQLDVQTAYVNTNQIAVLVKVDLPYDRTIKSVHILDLREGLVLAR